MAPKAVGVPIQVAGTDVAPGDLVIADANGVVIVPQDRAADVCIRASEPLRAPDQGGGGARVRLTRRAALPSSPASTAAHA